MTVRFNHQKIKRKHTRLTIIYIVVFSFFIFIFTPEYLIFKAKKNLKNSIYEIENNDSLPSAKDFIAFSFLKTASFFPFYKHKVEKTQIQFIRRYLEAYKRQCANIKLEAAASVEIKSNEFTKKEYEQQLKSKIDPNLLKNFCYSWKMLFARSRYKGFESCMLCSD